MEAVRRRLVAICVKPAAIPVGLAIVAYGLALLQRPGRTATDSRIELTADPGLFLARVADLWSFTFDLGHVQSGQFVGYLFPMGTRYAIADQVGLPGWLSG